MLKLRWIRSKPCWGLARWIQPQHIAVAWIWGVCMCQVLGRQKRGTWVFHQLQSEGGMCAACSTGSQANTGGSKSANLWKSWTKTLSSPPRPLCHPAFLSGQRCWHANCPPPPALSLSWPKLTELERFGWGGEKVTVQVEKYYQSHTDELLSLNSVYSTEKYDSLGFTASVVWIQMWKHVIALITCQP